MTLKCHEKAFSAQNYEKSKYMKLFVHRFYNYFTSIPPIITIKFTHMTTFPSVWINTILSPQPRNTYWLIGDKVISLH